MTVPEPTPVHSVDEFRRLYYPHDLPVLDYFDDPGPHNGAKDGEPEIATCDPLDTFDQALKRAK